MFTVEHLESYFPDAAHPYPVAELVDYSDAYYLFKILKSKS